MLWSFGCNQGKFRPKVVNSILVKMFCKTRAPCWQERCNRGKRGDIAVSEHPSKFSDPSTAFSLSFANAAGTRVAQQQLLGCDMVVHRETLLSHLLIGCRRVQLDVQSEGKRERDSFSTWCALGCAGERIILRNIQLAQQLTDVWCSASQLKPKFKTILEVMTPYTESDMDGNLAGQERRDNACTVSATPVPSPRQAFWPV